MLMTAYPCADAERWANLQDRREQADESLKARAMLMLESDLIGLTPTRWFKKLNSTSFSLDEMLADALGTDSNITTEFAKVMTGDSAQALRQLLIAHHADNHFLTIVPTDY